jgi:dihydropteroate synthase
MRGGVWRCGGSELTLDRTLVMAILNVTPDSFSDGGRFTGPQDAVAAGLRAVADGAAILDVGGESTRPGAATVTPAEELERVLPVVRALAEAGAIVSIDTRHAEVAAAAVEAGAAIVNDIGGFRDPAMLEVAAGSDAGCVAMHMLGEPATMQADPRYDDVTAEVLGFLAGRAAALEEVGVGRDRIALDPGIGFGKTTAHNLTLLRDLPRLAGLGFAVLVGVSRKRFIGELTGVAEPADRLEGTLAAGVWAAEHEADVLRVHDVAAHVRALAVTDALTTRPAD